MTLNKKVVRCLIFDPRFPANYKYPDHAGRLWSEVHPDGYTPYYSRVQCANLWLEHLNAAIGEDVYSFYGGAPEVINDFIPVDFLGQRPSLERLDDDQIHNPQDYNTPLHGGPKYLFGDGVNDYLSERDILNHYDIVNKVNNGVVDEVWFSVYWRQGPESIAVAPFGDQAAFRAHEGPIFVNGLSKRFVMMSVSGNAGHHYVHRAGAILSAIWNWAGASMERFANEEYAAQDRFEQPHSREDVRQNTLPALYFTGDNYNPEEGHAGNGHNTVGARQNYDEIDDSIVPSGYHLWKDLAANFPLKLGRNDRRKFVNSSFYLPAGVNGDPADQDHLMRGMAWVLAGMPQQESNFDNRLGNWWKYVIDINEEYGRNQGMFTVPWIEADYGARDARLSLTYSSSSLNGVRLSWRRKVHDNFNGSTYPPTVSYVYQGNYKVYWAKNGGAPEAISDLLSEDINTYEVPEQYWPLVGEYAFYAVVWYDLSVTEQGRISDVLGFLRRPSGELGKTAPQIVELSLNQALEPYVRIDGASYVAGSKYGLIRHSPTGALATVINNTWQHGKVGIADVSGTLHGGEIGVYSVQIWDHDIKNMAGQSDYLGFIPGISQV